MQNFNDLYAILKSKNPAQCSEHIQRMVSIHDNLYIRNYTSMNSGKGLGEFVYLLGRKM